MYNNHCRDVFSSQQLILNTENIMLAFSGHRNMLKTKENVQY